jgi:hypothetical protein
MQQNNKLLNNQRRPQNNLLQNQNPNQMSHIQAQQMYQIKQQAQNQTTIDKDKIKEILIKPIKLEKGNTLMTNKIFKEEEEKRKPKLEDYWKNRTNTPYKGILKDANNNVKNEKDLIVHRVSKDDKNVKEIENKFNDINEKIKTHDGELKVIYSTSKEREHKKKFEYTHIYQYRKHELNEDDTPQDHEKLRQNRFNYYKEQQKQQEKGKKHNAILDQLVSDGVFNTDELSGFDNKKTSEDKNINKKQMYLDRKNKN